MLFFLAFALALTGSGGPVMAATDDPGAMCGQTLSDVAAPRMVPVSILPPPEWLEENVVWGAVPLSPHPAAPEAAAMPYAISGAWQTEFYPGPWLVEGLAEEPGAGGIVFRAEIEVAGAVDQRFEIPVGLEPEGVEERGSGVYEPVFGSVPVEAAAGEAVSIVVEIVARNESTVVQHFEDSATGLRFVLPPGWGADEPYYYVTAGGVRASYPMMGFYPLDHVEWPPLVQLNPLRVTPGPCMITPAGEICHVDNAEAQAVAELIAADIVVLD